MVLKSKASYLVTTKRVAVKVREMLAIYTE
jgi:hypothetical protein